MNLKKILCAVISTATLTASLNALAAIPADVVGTRYESPIQVRNA